MESLELSILSIEKKPLYTPPLEEVANVLELGLSTNFAEVDVRVVQCPDLSASPYHLTSKAGGICGNAKLVEVGGPPYLLPLVRREKLYDLAAIASKLRKDERSDALLIGAGAGPWPHLGVNCEGIINLCLHGDGALDQGTRVVSIDSSGGYKQQRLPPEETRSALLGNYLHSDGLCERVIRVRAKRRIGKSNFISGIRESLEAHYGDRVVGMGGAFLLRVGKVKHHVMPDFSKEPIKSDEQVEQWLRFFEMKAPIVHYGTLVTGDLGLDLRVQHFHGWSEHGDGGHYHYDTTPEEVEYEGYFVIAQEIVRIDRPEETHAIGRD